MFLLNSVQSGTIIGCMIICVSASVQANITVRDGWNALRSDTINITSDGSGQKDFVFNMFAPSYLAIVDQPDPLGCGTNTAVKTIDGYTGKEIFPGVLLVIYDSTLTGEGQQAGAAVTSKTVIWDSKGKVSATASVAPYCYDVRTVSSNRLNLSAKLKTSGTIKTGVYVSKGTVMNGVVVPNWYAARTNASAYSKTQLLSSSGLVLDANLSSCTLSVPATVSFGEVANDKMPKTVPDNISVKCTGTDNTYNVAYKMTSKSGAATKTTLPMKNISSGNKVADIRGFLGEKNVEDAGCVDKNSSMLMNGTTSSLKADAKTNATEVIPVSWVLCPLDAAEPGPASTTATMEITW